MRLTAEWLEHPGTQALCRAFEARGFRALFVGGCVRNSILGRPVDDIDISTDARPEISMQIAEAAGFKAVPTGIDHGTVTLIAHGRPHEVTTFRRDVETDGRRAVVAYSTEISEDAARRDFTMNALYATREGVVVDPLNGLPDLMARRVRFVGEAEARIREDYLRILRFFRFHAHYGDMDHGFDAEGLAACAANSAGIETLSRERVWSEMRKLLSAPDPAPAIATMAQAGILQRILPGADVRALGPFLHLAELEGLEPDPVARLATLGGTALAHGLRTSKVEARRFGQLRDAAESTAAAGELGYRMGVVDGVTALVLRAALLEQPLGSTAEVKLGACAKFPIRAADLPELHGPELGRRLKELEWRWIASGFRLSKAELLG